jgi:hypothetical protein
MSGLINDPADQGDDPIEMYLDELLVSLPGSPREVRHLLAEVEAIWMTWWTPVDGRVSARQPRARTRSGGWVRSAASSLDRTGCFGGRPPADAGWPSGAF